MKRMFAIVICTISILVISAAVYFLVFVLYAPKVAAVYTVEAGENIPPADVFISNTDKPAHYVSGLPDNTEDIGEYSVEIAIEGEKKTHLTTLTVLDTVPPLGTTSDCVAFTGNVLPPETFIAEYTDVTEVKLSFVTEPDFNTPGDQTVSVLLTDEGGNETVLTANLRLYATVENLTFEAGSDGLETLTLRDVVPDLKYEDVPLFRFLNKAPDSTTVGKRLIPLWAGRYLKAVEVEIVDTTPPVASSVDVDGWLGDTYEAESFVKDAYDITALTYEYVQSPDFTYLGKQIVTVLITDEGGNSVEITSLLTLNRDLEPPKISGELHKRVFIGETVSYRSKVNVTDNRDANPRLVVDSSAVNLKAVGEYPVIYSSTDAAGNSVSVTGSITVYTATKDIVVSMAQDILSRIIDETMTDYDKAHAIHKWVRSHMQYRNSGRNDDIWIAAYDGFKNGVGNCYNYYAMCEIMLTHAGVENMMVQRMGGRTRHFWSIVNTGDGWYHFDTTPFKGGASDGFMMTDTRVAELTVLRGNNYYTYDKTLLPEVVQ